MVTSGSISLMKVCPRWVTIFDKIIENEKCRESSDNRFGIKNHVLGSYEIRKTSMYLHRLKTQ